MKLKFYPDRADQKVSPLYARISYAGNTLKFYPGESVEVSHWDPKLQVAKVSKKYPQASELNNRLSNISASIHRLFLQWQNEHPGFPYPDHSEFKELLNRTLKESGNVKRDFFGFFAEMIKRTEEGKRVIPNGSRKGKQFSLNTIKAYKSTLLRVREFSQVSNRKVDFKTIDQQFYDGFISFLQKDRIDSKDRKVKGLKNNAIGKHIKVIRLVMNEALANRLHDNMTFKARSFTVLTEQGRSPVYLTEFEIDSLYRAEMPNSKLEKVRDMFIIGCKTGLRFSDLNQLKPEHFKGGFIHVTTQKTGEMVTIPEHAIVREIRSKYANVLPQAISNQKANEYLKEIFNMIQGYDVLVDVSYTKGGLTVKTQVPKAEMITTHTARRSFATNAVKAGVSTFLIMKITGHKSEKAFREYIKLSPQEYGELMQIQLRNSNLRAVK
jgi:integrase